MHSTLRVATFYIAGCLIPALTTAQPVCQALLQGGAFDSSAMAKESFASDYFRSRHCESGTSSSSSSFKFGVPIPDFPIEFGGSNSSSNSHNICDDKTSSHQDWQKYLSWSKTASPVLAQAFVDCVKAEGTQVWTERSRVTNSFSVNARVHYLNTEYPPLRLEFSFTPAKLVGTCKPRTKGELQRGVSVGNLKTFKVDCEMRSQTAGVEIGLIASSEIPYANLAVRAYRPPPVIIQSTDDAVLDGVKVPLPTDETYQWGPDTLLTRYDGRNFVPPQGKLRSATWKRDVVPGLYKVYVTYSAAKSRPLRLVVDGRTGVETVAHLPTGGWEPAKRTQMWVGDIRLKKSTVALRLEATGSDGNWPHFKEMRLVFAGD